MSISKFEQLEQLATTNHDAAILLGDILSGWVSMKRVSIDYTRALQYYVLGYLLAPEEYKALMIPSWLKSKLPKFDLLFEAIRMPTQNEVKRLLKNI